MMITVTRRHASAQFFTAAMGLLFVSAGPTSIAKADELDDLFNDSALRKTDSQPSKDSADKLYEQYLKAMDDAAKDAGVPKPIRGAIRKYHDRNYHIAKGESTVAGKIIAHDTGISLDDIQKHKPAGGLNSVVNKVIKGPKF